MFTDRTTPYNNDNCLPPGESGSGPMGALGGHLPWHCPGVSGHTYTLLCSKHIPTAPSKIAPRCANFPDLSGLCQLCHWSSSGEFSFSEFSPQPISYCWCLLQCLHFAFRLNMTFIFTHGRVVKCAQKGTYA